MGAGTIAVQPSARKRPASQSPHGHKGRAGHGLKPVRNLPRQHQLERRALPIFKQRDALVAAVRKHQTVVLVGETGSGKSTQITQFLYEAGFCQPPSPGGDQPGAHPKHHKRSRLLIGCTQPRRVAAITVCRRVSEEMGCQLGHLVGYSVRFDDRTSASTAVKYMTDGVLLREAMADPLLSKYSVIILDEAHERSLQTDILFGLVRRIQPKRPELRVLVMSATLQTSVFLKFFRDSEAFTVPGRSYPVDTFYTHQAQDDYVEAALLTCLQIHEDFLKGLSSAPRAVPSGGDVLVFLPGQEDIEGLAQLLRDNLRAMANDRIKELTASGDSSAAEQSRPVLGEFLVCRIYAALPQEQQLEVFQATPPHTQKFILATNIAETSITVPGVRYVVDTGYVKTRTFNAGTGMESLKEAPVSKAQAQQRAGRAGRQAVGQCYRLYREQEFLKLQDDTTPEIQRVNLAQVVLQLKVMGVDRPEEFDFLSAPSQQALHKALETLLQLGALDKAGSLTAHGQGMAALPLDPVYAHLLLSSAGPKFRCTKEILAAVACLSAENILFQPAQSEARAAAAEAHKTFAAYEGDLPTLVNIFQAFLQARKDYGWCRQHYVNGRSLARALEVRDQLATILKERLGVDPELSCVAERSLFLKCLAAGLFLNVAQRQPPSDARKGGYRTVWGGRDVYIHPGSVLFGRNPAPKCVVYVELLQTKKEYIKTVTVVEQAWLAEDVPALAHSKSDG